MIYTTRNFVQGLINAIIAYMQENGVERIPLDFIAGRTNYSTCDIAKNYIKHNWIALILKNDKLYLEYNWGRPEWGPMEIVSMPVGYESIPKHHLIMTEEVIDMVRIAYDTIGNIHFEGRESESFDMAEIDELEKEYEQRRNE